MGPRVLGVLFFFVAVNAFAAFVTSHAYTAWCIRVRNQAWYLLLRREVNRERADCADAIATRHLRWIRPFGFFIANALVALFAVMLLSEG